MNWKPIENYSHSKWQHYKLILMHVLMLLLKDLNHIKKNVRYIKIILEKKRIELSLDENANDLDFEDSIDKHHATPTQHNESIKSSVSKQSLFFSSFP